LGGGGGGGGGLTTFGGFGVIPLVLIDFLGGGVGFLAIIYS